MAFVLALSNRAFSEIGVHGLKAHPPQPNVR